MAPMGSILVPNGLPMGCTWAVMGDDMAEDGSVMTFPHEDPGVDKITYEFPMRAPMG